MKQIALRASLFVWVIIVMMIAFSCTEPPQKNNVPEGEKSIPKHVIIQKPGSSANDTLVIKGRSAVFYNPDSLQMKKIKEINERNTYSTIIHDCYYQMQNARQVIRKYWPGVKVIENSKYRYLEFVKTDKSKVYIDLNNKNDICGLFLFDGQKDPVLADMPNIDTVLGFYFVK